MIRVLAAGDIIGKPGRRALAKLLPYQRSDFNGIFKALKGLPATIRLLDPPLHEFLPHSEDQQRDLRQPVTDRRHLVEGPV